MNQGPDQCIHLAVDQVLQIHAAAIHEFGGSHGLRDRPLLESAVAAPQATFGGVSPFTDLVDVAGAYLYYLCSNHPFVDGNKRVALGACLVFLKINGLKPNPDGEDWETLTLAVAAGVLSREEVTVRLRALVAV